MNKEEKALVIEELVKRFSENHNFYFTDASGLTVSEINTFRKQCYERGIEYKVFKNSLIKKALKRIQTDVDTWDHGILKGFTGIMFTRENGKIPALLLQEYRKKGAVKPVLKAALVAEELYVGEENLKNLTQIRTKTEMIGEIISLLQTPARNVVNALLSGKSTLAGIVKTLSDKEENN